jgi:hypothetical protein
MATLFTQSERRLAAMQLDEQRYLVGARPGGGIRVAPEGDFDSAEPAFALRRSRDALGRELWMLITLGAWNIRCNGALLPAGLRALAHCDELSFLADDATPRRLFFSAESPARAALHAGVAVECPRCCSEIAAGRDYAAACVCGALFHSEPTRACFGYAACHHCGEPQELGAALRWKPALS